MRKFYKLLVAVLVLLSLTIMPVLAASVTVTWEWLNLDPDVTAFRYQLDGEEEGNWTVVDSTVNMYEANGLDSALEYTLYLQQSYDGVNWSASAAATSYPLEAEEDWGNDWTDEWPEDEVIEEPIEEEWVPEPVAEDPLFYTEDGEAVELDETQQETLAISFELEEQEAEEVAELEAEVAELETEVAELEAEVEPVVVPVEEVKKAKVPQNNDFKFSLLLSPGVEYTLGTNRIQNQSVYTFKADLSLGFDNIIKMGKSAGIGFQINAGADLTVKGMIQDFVKDPASWIKLDTYNKALSGDVLLNLAFNGKSNMFIVGVGGTALFRYQAPVTSPGRFTVGDFAVDLGAMASIQYRQFLGKVFSIGLDANYTYMFIENNPVQSVGAKLTLGLTF